MRINDVSVLRSIARLSINPDFEVFIESVVKKQYQEAVNACISEPDPAQAQGRAQVLNDILDTVTDSRKALKDRERATSQVSAL